MRDLHEEHIHITDEVKHIIEPLNIVFPAYYGQIYSEIAHSHDIELTPEELLNPEMFDEKIVRNILTLSEYVSEAIEAMEKEDKALLRSLLFKTKQLEAEIQELQKIIYEDTLTQSYNRKWFEDKLLDTSKIKLRDSGTLVMIDLNRFKEINDTHGHIVGDKVLSLVAHKLRETKGRVVRYGGDEFIVIFDHKISTSDVKASIESLLAYFQKVHLKAGEHSFKIDFAYGMAPFTRDANVSTVIETADKAMYTHKKENGTALLS